MRRGLRAVQSTAERDILVVNAAIGFTSLFLLPRLGEFQSLHPEIRLQISTRDQNRDFDPADCDIAIVFDEAGRDGPWSRPVFGEEMLPVCRPGYLPGDRPLEREALPGHRLLHLSSVDHAEDWQRYFQGSDIAPPEPPPQDRFLSYMVYLRAIQNGLGIGLGWRGLVDDLIANGSLVVACARPVRTTRGYHCRVMPGAVDHPGARVFQEWIGGLAEGAPPPW